MDIQRNLLIVALVLVSGMLLTEAACNGRKTTL